MACKILISYQFIELMFSKYFKQHTYKQCKIYWHISGLLEKMTVLDSFGLWDWYFLYYYIFINRQILSNQSFFTSGLTVYSVLNNNIHLCHRDFLQTHTTLNPHTNLPAFSTSFSVIWFHHGEQNVPTRSIFFFIFVWTFAPHTGVYKSILFLVF